MAWVSCPTNTFQLPCGVKVSNSLQKYTIATAITTIKLFLSLIEELMTSANIYKTVKLTR